MMAIIFRKFLFLSFILGFATTASASSNFFVMNARSGELIIERQSSIPMHPAGLAKLMALFIVFEEVNNQNLAIDHKVEISRKAAAEPGVVLGLRPGSRIGLAYLVRASIVLGANDAATALAEAVSGSEAKFVEKMVQTGNWIGLSGSAFKNPHGLTERDFYMSARDIGVLFSEIRKNFPNLFQLFGAVVADAGVKNVESSGRYLLDAMPEISAVKTGYTRAAGFNAVVLAERGGEEIIIVVLGCKSREAQVAQIYELMNFGFRKVR